MDFQLNSRNCSTDFKAITFWHYMDIYFISLQARLKQFHHGGGVGVGNVRSNHETVVKFVTV